MVITYVHSQLDTLGLNPGSPTVSYVKVHGQCSLSEHFSSVKWAQEWHWLVGDAQIRSNMCRICPKTATERELIIPGLKFLESFLNPNSRGSISLTASFAPCTYIHMAATLVYLSLWKVFLKRCDAL